MGSENAETHSGSQRFLSGHTMFFSYTSYPPTNPRRVVWYQYVSKGYPLVYDPLYPNDVIDKFKWKTDLYGDPSSWDCSLLIKNLEQSHHGEKLYTWIDPENVGKSTYKFYDVTSTIQVDGTSIPYFCKFA